VVINFALARGTFLVKFQWSNPR